MPSEIQARIAHTIDTAIDTRLGPQTLALHKEVAALATAQQTTSNLIKGTIRDVGRHTVSNLEDKIKTLSISHAESTERIQKQSKTILATSQTPTAEGRAASAKIKETLSTFSTNQSTSTDLISQSTALVIQNHSSVSRDQTSSLHLKLDHMSSLIMSVKDRLGDLTIAQQSARMKKSNSELQKSITNIQRSACLLVSALYILAKELM